MIELELICPVPFLFLIFCDIVREVYEYASIRGEISYLALKRNLSYLGKRIGIHGSTR